MKRIFMMLMFSLLTTLLAREDSAYFGEILKPYDDKFGQLMLEDRFEELIDLYDKDIILIRPFAPPVKGLTAMRKELKMLKDAGFHYHSISGEIEDVWGCDDQIFERSTLAFSCSTRNEPEIKSFYGSSFSIWQKQKDNTYKLKFSIWNLDFNPWAE